MGVDLPVVACLVIAAGAVQGEVPVRQLVGGGKSDAVDERADRMAVELGINGDHDAVGYGRGYRRAIRYQGHVIHVKSAERRSALALNPDSIQVGLVGDSERRKWNRDLLPRAGGWGKVVLAARHGAPEGRPYRQRLSSAGASMNPKGQIGVGSRVKIGVLEVQPSIPVGNGNRHGTGAGVNGARIAETDG